MARIVKIYRVLVDGNPRSGWVGTHDIALKIAENLMTRGDRDDPLPDGAVSVEISRGQDFGEFGGGLREIDGSPRTVRYVWKAQIEKNRESRRAGRQRKSARARLEHERRRAQAQADKEGLKEHDLRIDRERAEPRRSALGRGGARAVRRAALAPPSPRGITTQRLLEAGGEASGASRRQAERMRKYGSEAGVEDQVYDDPAPAFTQAKKNLRRKMKELRVRFKTGGALFEVSFDGKYRFPAMAHFVEVDGSGGLRLNNAAFAIPEEAQLEINTALSREAVRSVKGGASILKERGRYPFGILKGKGPDGRIWAPLTRTTLWFRHLKAGGADRIWDNMHYSSMMEFVDGGQFFDPATGHLRDIPTERGQGFKLRETSKHIFHGLKPLEVFPEYFVIGWDGHQKDTGAPVSMIALKQHRGFVTSWDAAFDRGYTGDHKYSFSVPGRPFIGFQPQFFKNAGDIALSLIRWHVLGRRTPRGGQVIQNLRLRKA